MIEGELRAGGREGRADPGWSAAGRLAPVDPHHLIFSIWATTQHYADFDVQVRGILHEAPEATFEAALAYLTGLFRSALAPCPSGRR